VAELVIHLPQGRTRSHRLGDRPVTLGRDPGCDIPLEDLGASRRHAVVRADDNGYLVEDLGSKNGTLINNALARQARLKSGDEIVIGSVRILFHEDPPCGLNSTVIVADEEPRRDSTTYRGRTDELELSRRRLERLYELAHRLTRLRERDELLCEAMDVCFEELRFERGAIAVRQARGNLVDWPVVRNLRGREGELKVSRTILSSALVRGERVIVNDADVAMLDPTVSMVAQNIRSAMCVPLLANDRNLGVIYGDRVTTGTTYTQEDVDFLAGIGRLISTGLVNAQLLDEQKLHAQLEAEVAMARQIQQGLFPKRLPDHHGVSFAALNHPGSHVSGDYYDVIELPDGRLAFLIADVTGEGVAAAMLMANLQAAVRLTIRQDRPLPELLAQWNALVVANTDASRFITLLIGILDPTTRTIEFGVAGHHPPFLLQPGGRCTTIEVEPDYPLGVIDDATYSTSHIQLPPGPATLVLYTDGVIEAMDADLNQYSAARAAKFLSDAGEIVHADLIAGLREDVRKFTGTDKPGDDITILALRLS
jgi:serine phosphatase RsbU (regulator of sigma subunit)/pSer/pThr/pTyr-binding forkhead associated (FHA) protein